MIKNGSNTKGMTLIEILIVVSIVLAFSSVGIVSYITFQNTAITSADIRNVRSALYQARQHALKTTDGLAYGVYIDDLLKKIVIFKGNSYSDSERIDEEALIRLYFSNINLQPVPGVTKEIVFQKKTGKSINAGSFDLAGPGITHTFTINVQGKIY